MIEKIKSIYKPYMTRPMIQLCAIKVAIAAVVILVYDRFLRQNAYISIVSDMFFFLGCFFLACTWFHYLGLDGIKIPGIFNENRKKDGKKRKKLIRKTYSDMSDYTDEQVVSLSELEPEEKKVCRFLANLICGLLFLIPSLVSLLF